MVVNSAAQVTCPALKLVFEAINPESCPHSYNFHMHTVCSDGKLQPEALIQQAIALGLKGLAITDHHSVQGYQAANQWLTTWKPSSFEPAPLLWSGVEISAKLLTTEVHILGYGFDPNHPGLQPYLQGQAPQNEDYQAQRVIAALHTAGGLAILAHPARYSCSPAELIPAAANLGIDGVETYYCYNNPPVWSPSPQQTALIYALGSSHGLLHTCGTDTHGLNLLRRL